ncbi:MAG TPA: M56 family metallopeptidase [Pyrinomonadaceae bacterium]|nr:M56 family metallopeptidase [Pyrinomonadaceae bacterium]
MYELLGICLVLASLLSINALASLAAAACSRLLRRPLQNRSARTRAEILFALRVGPMALAFISVSLFLVPSYLGYEPYATSEIVSKKLAALAILSAIGVALALSRALRSWLATRSLLHEWLSSAIQIRLDGTSIPTFRIPNSFPIIAVVGTFRPRLFIAERVLETLSAEELTAAIAHEGGHLYAHDNLRRSLLRVCGDLLMIVPCGQSLDRAWTEAAECAADEHAVQQSAETALNLASALVKIAKMVPVGARAAVPLAAFLVGVEETRGVKARVRRLLEIASNSYLRRVPNPTIARILPAASLCGLFLLALVVANNPSVLLTVHNVIEHAVKLLS